MLAEIISEIRGLDMSNKELRKFGFIFSAFLGVIAWVICRKNIFYCSDLITASALFIFLAITNPRLLKVFYGIWRTFGFIMKYIMTRVILILVFFLVFTPVGLFLKIYGKDLLDRKIEEGRESYWIKHEASGDKSRYLKTF